MDKATYYGVLRGMILLPGRYFEKILKTENKSGSEAFFID